MGTNLSQQELLRQQVKRKKKYQRKRSGGSNNPRVRSASGYIRSTNESVEPFVDEEYEAPSPLAGIRHVYQPPTRPRQQRSMRSTESGPRRRDPLQLAYSSFPSLSAVVNEGSEKWIQTEEENLFPLLSTNASQSFKGVRFSERLVNDELAFDEEMDRSPSSVTAELTSILRPSRFQKTKPRRLAFDRVAMSPPRNSSFTNEEGTPLSPISKDRAVVFNPKQTVHQLNDQYPDPPLDHVRLQGKHSVTIDCMLTFRSRLTMNRLSCPLGPTSSKRWQLS